jgi:hypothetical protein
MLSLLLFVVTAVNFGVSATEYCQCESVTYSHVFPGIQIECNKLSDNWCPTNCNIFTNGNCDYCQYKPKDVGSKDDFQKLVDWCHNQYIVIGGVNITGEYLKCYSAANKANCLTCGSCIYLDNDTKKKSTRLMKFMERGLVVAEKLEIGEHRFGT